MSKLTKSATGFSLICLLSISTTVDAHRRKHRHHHRPPVVKPAPTDNGTMPTGDECHAGELRYLVGKPDTVLHTMRFGQTTRLIRPGTAVTEDYSQQRLNIDIDVKGVIRRLWCG